MADCFDILSPGCAEDCCMKVSTVNGPSPPHGRDKSGPYTRAINCRIYLRYQVYIFVPSERNSSLSEPVGAIEEKESGLP